MAANSDRDDSMLSVGKQCSHRTCNLVDFLPYKCQHCEQAYCGDHFLPQAHQCEKYDENKHNRVAPPCPFCKVPIAIPLGEDPNIRMERHFDTDCSVLTGKAAKSSTPRCSRPICRKVLFSAIRCDKCKLQFCPQHRFPDDHKCSGSTMTSKASTPPSGTSTPNSRPNPTSAAAMAAIKRAVNNTTSAASAATQKMAQSTPNRTSPRPTKVTASASATSNTSVSSTRSAIPFSATDRRAKAEKESRLKAMQARAKKGLLSEEEQVLLKAAEAEKASDKDCVIA